MPLRLQKGQIWTTSPEPRNRLEEVVAQVPMAVPVLVISPGNGERTNENTIRVLPISTDVDFHLEGETLVLVDDSPLHYPILVEIFNESPMLAGNLGEYRGAVSKTRLEEIRMLRQSCLDRPIPIKQDKHYLQWKQKEMEMTRYLTFPLNEAIWSDSVETGVGSAEAGASNATSYDISLMPYKKAADADGMNLSEIRPFILMEDDRLTLAVVQKGDQVVLRFLSDTLLPEIVIDHEKISLEKRGEGFLEAVLGYCTHMPETMSIIALIDAKQFIFHLNFREVRDA